MFDETYDETYLLHDSADAALFEFLHQISHPTEMPTMYEAVNHNTLPSPPIPPGHPWTLPISHFP
jgi:hypothetical protein